MTERTFDPVLWTDDEAAAVTGGHGASRWQASGVSIDTRTLAPGDLFVAIRGERMDGHRFVGEALAKGAAAAVIDAVEDIVAPGKPALRVEDTKLALEALAGAARDRSPVKVAAVTGSVGKTGSKEALRLALGRLGLTHATLGNLNNHWGVPLTLARMPRNADFAVIEMGMNHANEIRPLSLFTRPHVALITTIDHVHSAHFRNLEAIADAKAEIFEGLAPGGTAVLNRDNAMYNRLVDTARACAVDRIIGFGTDDAAPVRLLEADADDSGSDVSVEIDGRRLSYRISVPGRHWVLNSLGVLGVVHALSGDLEEASLAFQEVQPPKGRGNRQQVSLPDGTVTLIDESYNASPASMTAALEVLCTAVPTNSEAGTGRRIAVLGDMLELGSQSAVLHGALAEMIERLGIDQVYAAGQYMSEMFDRLPKPVRAGYAMTSEKLIPLVMSGIRPGDVVLIKGSLGSRMGLIVNALLALGQNGGSGASSGPQAMRAAWGR